MYHDQRHSENFRISTILELGSTKIPTHLKSNNRLLSRTKQNKRRHGLRVRGGGDHQRPPGHVLYGVSEVDEGTSTVQMFARYLQTLLRQPCW